MFSAPGRCASAQKAEPSASTSTGAEGACRRASSSCLVMRTLTSWLSVVSLIRVMRTDWAVTDLERGRKGWRALTAEPVQFGAVEFGILGPLQVHAGGAAVEIRRGLSRRLVIALVLRPNETVGGDALVELLWGDALPRDPANALQIQVSYLRKTLAAAEPDGGRLIVTRPAGYALAVEPDQVDAGQFVRLLREAADHEASPSDDALEKALG